MPIDPAATFYRNKGCKKCKDSGFVGRTGVFELLVISDEIKKMVEERRSADEIKKKAVEQGMTTLRDDGLLKARNGITTLEEIWRVTETD